MATPDAAVSGECELVIWNAFAESRNAHAILGHNALRVIKSFNRKLIIKGHMDAFLSRLFGTKILRQLLTKHGRSPVPELQANLSALELLSWRISLFIGIGATVPLISLIEKYRNTLQAVPDEYLRLKKWRAETLFQLGRYNDARAVYRSIAKDASSKGSLKSAETELSMLEGMIECDRATLCFERSFLPFYFASQVLKTIVDDKKGKSAYLALVKAELIEIPYAQFKLSSVPLIGPVMRKKLYRWLSESSNHFAENGNWHELQICVRVSERVGIDIKKIIKSSTIPLPSVHGFAHLGDLRGDIMALREQPYWTKNDVARARKLLRQVKILNLSPETWKLALDLRCYANDARLRHVLYCIV